MTKIKFITFGCSNNFAETEIMTGLAKKEGFELVESGEDITIINVCNVKGPSINKALKILKDKKKAIITGCVNKHVVEKIKKIKKEVSILDTNHIKDIVNTLRLLEQNTYIEKWGQNKIIKCDLPKIRKNKIINILPIGSGCNYNCTFCATKLSKGKLFSFPEESIISEAKKSIKDGCKEIWITSQDTGAYGQDINKNLPALLNKILLIEGNYFIRLGMTNPNHIIKNIEEYIKIFKNPKMFKFIHIPVQSGSNKLLKEMKRPHKVQDYEKIIKKLKKAIPDMTISTDLIIGYPLETDNDFKKSMKLLEKTKPDVLNISKFWAMEGTKAKELKPLPSEIIKQRALETKKTFDKIALKNNKKWIGWEGKILIDEKGKNNTMIGRNQSYKPIIVKQKHKLGEIISVKIKKVTPYDLRTF